MEHKPIHKINLNLNEVYGEIKEELKGNFKIVECPSCSTEIGAENININDKIAKCSSCNAVFSIDGVVESFRKATKQTEIDLPVGVEKYYFGDELDLTLQQTPSMAELWSLPLIPIIGFMGFALYDKGVIPLLVPILFVALSAIPIISLINLKRHKTHIRVGRNTIDIGHRPKKFRKDVGFESSAIQQLYSQKYSDGNGSVAYRVMVVLNSDVGQSHSQFLGGLKTIREAKYIEQEVEAYLQIENQEMLEERDKA